MYSINSTPDPLRNGVHLHHDSIRPNSETVLSLSISRFKLLNVPTFVHWCVCMCFVVARVKENIIFIFYSWMVSFVRKSIENRELIHDKRWIDNGRTRAMVFLHTLGRAQSQAETKTANSIIFHRPRFDFFIHLRYIVCFLDCFFLSFSCAAHFADKQIYLN